MRSANWFQGSLLVFLAACHSAASPSPGSAAEPTPSLVPVAQPAPSSASSAPLAAAADAGCDVAVRTRVVQQDATHYELIATAANETDHALDTVISHGCPGTAARFEGLPASYDLGNRCQVGACAGGPIARTALKLAVGAASEIARVTVDTSVSACNPALSPGQYSIGAALDLTGLHSCTTSRALLVVQAAGTSAPKHVAAPVQHETAPHPATPAAPRKEPCPAMGCAYSPCPPGVPPPTGCAAVCGCPGARIGPGTLQAPPSSR